MEFSEIQGATQLNGLKLRATCGDKPRYKNPRDPKKACFKFEVDVNGIHLDAYSGWGKVSEVLLPQTASFDSLSDSLANPGRESNMFFFEEPWTSPPAQLHIAFAAFNALSVPRRPSSSIDPDVFLSACHAAYATMSPEYQANCGQLNESLIRTFARTCSGNLNPISAVAGGIAAQEAIKACSQKSLPRSDPQWLYFDALEAAPCADASDFDPRNCRYDDQLAVFGSSMQDILGGLKVFLVGAGALGCELLKNFAMMGVACGESGKIIVTDNDHIEKSNLSRQFLFRSHHIGRGKSECAAESVKAINSSLK